MKKNIIGYVIILSLFTLAAMAAPSGWVNGALQFPDGSRQYTAFPTPPLDAGFLNASGRYEVPSTTQVTEGNKLFFTIPRAWDAVCDAGAYCDSPKTHAASHDVDGGGDPVNIHYSQIVDPPSINYDYLAIGTLDAGAAQFNGPLTIKGTLSADGGTGSAGQVLTSNGANPPYWAAIPAPSISYVTESLVVPTPIAGVGQFFSYGTPAPPTNTVFFARHFSSGLLDLSASPHVITNTNVAYNSIASKWIYGNSLFGASSKYTVPVTGFSVGSGDFAFTTWSYPTAKNTLGGIFLSSSNKYFAMHYGYNNSDKYVVIATEQGGSGEAFITNADNNANISDSVINTWHYVEFSRTSGTFYLYVDGKLSFRITGRSEAIQDPADWILVGQWTNSAQYYGYLEDTQMVVGTGGHVTEETVVGTQIYSVPTASGYNSGLSYMSGTGGVTFLAK